MPLYQHDCDSCTYLGEYEGKDLYYHAGNNPSVIARCSSEPSDYSSGLCFAFTMRDTWSPLNEALFLVLSNRHIKWAIAEDDKLWKSFTIYANGNMVGASELTDEVSRVDYIDMHLRYMRVIKNLLEK